MSKRLTHISAPGYATLLRKLHDHPCTSMRLAARMGRSCNQTMRELMYRMRALGLVHVGGWEDVRGNNGGFRYSPIWHYGPGADVPPPGRTRPLKTALQPRIELLAFAALVHALMREPQSLESLAEVSGLSAQTAGRLVRHMRSIGLVYLADWERRVSGGGAPTPLYAIGIDRKDEQRPERMSRLQIERRYRAARAAREAQQFIHRALASSATRQEEACA